MTVILRADRGLRSHCMDYKVLNDSYIYDAVRLLFKICWNNVNALHYILFDNPALP